MRIFVVFHYFPIRSSEVPFIRLQEATTSSNLLLACWFIDEPPFLMRKFQFYHYCWFTVTPKETEKSIPTETVISDSSIFLVRDDYNPYVESFDPMVALTKPRPSRAGGRQTTARASQLTPKDGLDQSLWPMVPSWRGWTSRTSRT